MTLIFKNMQPAISIKTHKDRLLISIDKSYVEKEFLIRLMNQIRLEYLAKKVDFEADIEFLGEEIKVSWWDENKDKLLNPAK